MMLNKEMLDISLLMLKGTVERIDVKIILVRLNDLLFLQKKSQCLYKECRHL